MLRRWNGGCHLTLDMMRQIVEPKKALALKHYTTFKFNIKIHYIISSYTLTIFLRKGEKHFQTVVL